MIGNPTSGKALYLQNCVPCHGVEGDGNGPRAYFIFPRPRNFIQADAAERFDRPALFRAIQDGVQGREMPAWGKVLNAQQIADLAEYLMQAFIQPHAKTVAKP